MENVGIGAGLGAMAFWIFVAAVVVASYWDAIKKRETQHETIRRVIESGKEIDEATMNRLMTLGKGSSGRVDRDFKVTALWMLPVGPSLLLMGYILSSLNEDFSEAFIPLLAVGGMLLLMSVGFWISGMVVSRWYKE